MISTNFVHSTPFIGEQSKMTTEIN